MRTRHRVNKSEATASGSNKATHRLTEIDVAEVSIVDRGANQRTYLVVKDEKGKGDSDKSEAATQPTAKSGEVPALPSQPDQPDASPPPAVNITAEAKTQMLTALKAAQERLGAITKTVEGATVAADATLPAELVEEMTRLSQLFAPKPDADKTDAEKAGRKISGARMQQLQSMRATLDAMIAETSSEAATTEETAETEEPAEAEKSAKPPQPSAELAEVSGAVAKLATTVAKMVEVFEGQNQRIDALAKSTGESRQADLDSPRQPEKPKKVVWDMDMASPLKTVQ